MQTQTVTLYINKRVIPSPFDFEKDVEVSVYDLSSMDHCRGEYVVIGTQEVEVPIPDVDVTAQAIEALESQSAEVMAKARAEVEKINERIRNLRCLEYQDHAA